MDTDEVLALQAERRILLLRSQKVLLDADLADLYDVETKALNQAVRRNLERFPEDFMFQLSAEEVNALVDEQGANRSQFVTSSQKHRDPRYRPYAFTEQGVAMLSSVLRGERAVAVNIAIMRTFVRLRQMLASHADLARKLEELEKKYDSQFRVVFDALRQLVTPEAKPRREIGFHTLTAEKPAKSKSKAKR